MKNAQQLKFFDLIFTGHLYSKILTNTHKVVTTTKESEEFLKEMRCIYRAYMKQKFFYCWGIDFIGPFPLLYHNNYILVVVHYMSKWVERIASPKATGQTMVKFLKKNIFSHFGTPRVLISDIRSYFRNNQLARALEHYGVRHKVVSP